MILCATADDSGARAHEAGVALMEAGSFEAAQTRFTQALHVAKGEACAREAQYLAAVCLCKARGLALSNDPLGACLG